MVSSFLGETATNLRRIFDYIQNGKWVVLFDEFDIIGKQRDDPSEHGEIKRVVNNFMLMIEKYDSDSIIIASTNHPQLLDLGVWRRFDDVIFFGLPNRIRREKIFVKYLNVMKKEEINFKEIIDKTDGFSGSDIQHTCTEALKKLILSDREVLHTDDLMEAVLRQRAKMKIRRKADNE